MKFVEENMGDARYGTQYLFSLDLWTYTDINIMLYGYKT